MLWLPLQIIRAVTNVPFINLGIVFFFFIFYYSGLLARYIVYPLVFVVKSLFPNDQGKLRELTLND